MSRSRGQGHLGLREFGWVGQGHTAGPVGPVRQGQTSREEAGDGEGSRGRGGHRPRTGAGTRHWKMLASLPPSEMRCESSCVNRTLVTWLPWPPYTGSAPGQEKMELQRPRNSGRPPRRPREASPWRARRYWKRCTLQKSSATARRAHCEAAQELMSVPSEPSGHTPVTAAGLSPTDLPAPTCGPELHHFPLAQAARPPHPPRSWQYFPVPRASGGGGGRAALGLDLYQFLDVHPYTCQHS